MSMTRNILELLTQGESLTVAELSTKAGISMERVRWIIADLRERGDIKSHPATYFITEAGQARQKFLELKPKVAIKPRKTQKKRETSVEIAGKAIPNSVFTLGVVQ